MSDPPNDSDPGPPEDGSSDAGLPIDESKLDPFQRVLLEQPTRREIVDVLARLPGLNKNQLAQRLPVVRRTAVHHVDVLASADLLVVRPSERGREKLCFLHKHAHLWEDRSTRILYGQAPTRIVALYLVDTEPVTTDEIVQALEKTPAAVRTHLARLRERGLATKLRGARRSTHFATDQLRDWVKEWGDEYRGSAESDG